MVTIVTGKINSGKTTKMLNCYEATHKGDGFVAIKIMQGNSVFGYDLKHLCGKTYHWMIHQNHYQGQFEDEATFGPYHINLATLAIVSGIVKDLVTRRISPIYIDEVGVLELNGGGFHNLISEVLAARLDLVLAIREDLVKPFLAHFQIKDYELIHAQREE